MSYKWSVSFRYTHRNPLGIPIIPHTCHTSPPISSIFDHPNRICCGIRTMKLSSRGFLQPPVFPLCCAPISSSNPSVYFLFLTRENKFSTHNTYTHILGGIIRRSSNFWKDICTGDRDTKYSHSVFIFVSSRFLYLSSYTNKMHNVYSLHVFTLSPTSFDFPRNIIRENLVPFA